MAQVIRLAPHSRAPIPPIGEWFNATSIAVSHGKTPEQVQTWLSSAENTEYMEAMAHQQGKASMAELFRQQDDGLWLHPNMYVRFARWAYPDFDEWANQMIAGGLCA